MLLLVYYPKSAPAPLDAVNVFFGGDVWQTLICQVGGTPIAKIVDNTTPKTKHKRAIVKSEKLGN